MTLYLLFSFFVFLCKSVEDINCDISKGSVVIESKSLTCNGLSSQNIQADQKIVIGGASKSNYISVTNSDATLYFKNLNIDFESAVSISGGNVKILFEGTNTIKSGDNAGIKCYNKAKITFSNGTQDDNHQNCILKASSDSYTGIGVDYEVSNCSELIFLGGRIEATGGIWGAGIGTGLGSDKYGGNVDLIKIVSGSITAVGGRYAAGIGCGRGQAPYSSNVKKIEIYGGSVSGQSSEYGAGIGAGFGNGDNSASVTSLFIYGGEVNGKGGEYGAGVGGGYGFGTNSASIDEVNLAGGSKVEHAQNDFTVCTSLVSNGGGQSEKGVGNGKSGQVKKINTNAANLNCNNKYCDFKYEANCARPWKCSSSSSSDCPQCEQDYTLVSGQCVSTSSGGDGGNSGGGDSGGGDDRPADGGEGCIESTPRGVCLKCEAGYQLKDGACFKCPAESHCLEYQDSCYCMKCESPYYLVEGICTMCNVQFCNVINDDCTCKQCKNGYVLETPYVCRSCGISHCSHFVNGCECSVCDSGYSLINGQCVACNVPHCDSFVSVENSCVCSICAEGYKDFDGVCHKIPINYEKIPSFVYCPNMNDFRCTEYTNDWALKKNFLIQKITNIINAPDNTKNPNERSRNLAYRLFIDDIRNSDQPINAKQDINNQLKNLKTKKEKIIIYQFGSMGSGASYNFAVLKKKFDIVIVCLDHIIYGSGATIRVKPGKLKNVRSLTCYLGELYLEKGTLNVDNIQLIAAPIYSNGGSIQSDYFLIDGYSLASIDDVSKKINNFAVIFPERNKWNYMTLTDDKKIDVQPGPYPFVSVPRNVGKKQTSVIGFSNDIMLRTDPVKEIKDEINISVQSNGSPVNLQLIGNEWSNVKLKKNLLIESDDPNSISLIGKPKKGKVMASERYDETKEYSKKSKLSRGVIAVIVVVILVVIAIVVWFIVFLLCVEKPEANTQEEKSMKTTNELFQPVFQDDN